MTLALKLSALFATAILGWITYLALMHWWLWQIVVDDLLN